MKIQIRRVLARQPLAVAPAAATPAPSDIDDCSNRTHNLSANDVKEISMNTGIQKVALPALLALSGMAALTPVCSHADDSSTHSERVSIAHLDRHSPEGARKIYARLTAAALNACGESSMDIDYMVRGGPSDCVKQALANAVLEVRSAELSQLFIKRNGMTVANRYGVTPEILTASK